MGGRAIDIEGVVIALKATANAIIMYSQFKVFLFFFSSTFVRALSALVLPSTLSRWLALCVASAVIAKAAAAAIALAKRHVSSSLIYNRKNRVRHNHDTRVPTINSPSF